MQNDDNFFLLHLPSQLSFLFPVTYSKMLRVTAAVNVCKQHSRERLRSLCTCNGAVFYNALSKT